MKSLVKKKKFQEIKHSPLNGKTTIQKKPKIDEILKKYQKENNGEIYLLLDCSGSMSTHHKMEQAKSGAIGFCEEAINKGYLVGLILFADSAEILISPQNDIKKIKNRIKFLNADGSTNLTDALKLAANYLKSKDDERIICVVTDGMPNNLESALNQAKKAHKEGIDIMAIGTDDANMYFLEKLANRKELTIKVQSSEFEIGIKNMAKLLPGK